jgi:RNA polymerase sigma factor for flagellar operon FliA
MNRNKKYDIDTVWKNFIKNRTNRSKRILVEHYHPYVKKIAAKLAEKLSWHVQPDELASLGIDGLYKAIDSYDTERNVKFESYASQRIRGSMIDGLRREDQVPRSVRIASERFDRYKQKHENKIGHRISDSEYAAIIGISEEFNKNHKKYVPKNLFSFDNSVDFDDDNAKYYQASVLEDKHVSCPDAKIRRREFFSKLLGKNFSKLERKIVYLYYYENVTMDKVAKSIGLSESRVSQMHKDIIERLRSKISRNPSYFAEDVELFIAECRDTESLF